MTRDQTSPPRYMAGKGATADRSRRSRPTPLDPDRRSRDLTGIIAPPTPELDWRDLDLDDATFDTISPSDLITYLLDLSPELSRALWDFLRFTNPGWEITALRPGQEEVTHAQGQELLNDFIHRLRDYYGSPDVVINRLFTGAFIRGAVFTELVLDENGREMIDLATPDPQSARFKKVEHELRGTIWQLGQYQDGVWVPLDEEPTVHYVPVDPLPGNPYGRAPILPAVFSGLFILGLLHDIRRVIAQQGYPRYDISIDSEKLLESMPTEVRADEKKREAWVGAIVDAVTEVYSSLQPDDAYIHTDIVTVNRPTGAVDSSSLGGIDPVIRILERMVVRALKTMPLTMGINEATSETHANRQWEIQAAGIKSIQHLVESTLEDLLRLGLQAGGVQADVRVRFAELRTSEMLRDALTERQLILNAREKYNAGWISQDEAAQEVTGNPADTDTPRDEMIGNGLEPLSIPENYSGPSVGTRAPIEPDGSDLSLPGVPDTVTFSIADVEAVADVWDELMGDRYQGLIYAETDGTADAFLPLSRQTDWLYETDRRRYVNQETGTVVTWSQAVRLRDRFLKYLLETERSRSRWLWRYDPDKINSVTLEEEVRAIDPDGLAEQLANGEITVQEWLVGMRQGVKEAYIAQYALGVGGIENMSFADYGRIGNMLAPRGQYYHLQQMAEQIQDGQLSQAQIAARSRNYISSSVQAYERGRAVAMGVYAFLPEFPGDGNQDCKGNCRCSWKIEETQSAWRCTWVLDPSADHCQTCSRNGSAYNPLIIDKANRMIETHHSIPPNQRDVNAPFSYNPVSLSQVGSLSFSGINEARNATVLAGGRQTQSSNHQEDNHARS